MIAAVLWAALPFPAIAAECTDRDAAVNELQVKYNMSLTDVALQVDGTVIEVFRDPGDRWAIIRTDAKGISCLVAQGDPWIEVQSEVGEVPREAS